MKTSIWFAGLKFAEHKGVDGAKEIIEEVFHLMNREFLAGMLDYIDFVEGGE